MRISDWSSDVCSSDLTILSGDIETVIVVTAQDCRAGRNGALRIDQAFAVDEVGPQRARGTFDIFLQSSVAVFRDLPIARAEFDEDSQVEKNFVRSEEHTSELQSLMRISYAVFCLKKKTKTKPV